MRFAMDDAAQDSMVCLVLLALAFNAVNALAAFAFTSCMAHAVRGEPENSSHEAQIRCFVPPDSCWHWHSSRLAST